MRKPGRKGHLVNPVKKLFMQGKTYEDIQAITGVSVTSISKWVKRYGWKEERDKLSIHPTTLARKTNALYQKELNRLLEQDGPMTAKQADMLSKIANAAGDMGSTEDFPTMAITVMSKYVPFIQASDLPEEHQSIIFENVQSFLDAVREEAF